MKRHRPELYQAYLELGYAYQELGNFRKAREYYAKLEAAGKLSQATRLNIAYISAEVGSTKTAGNELTALILDDPGDVAARHTLARFWT